MSDDKLSQPVSIRGLSLRNLPNCWLTGVKARFTLSVNTDGVNRVLMS